MSNVSIARRYARALLDVAGTQADQVLSQLSNFVKLMEKSDELKELMTNPRYTLTQRSAVLEGLLRATSGVDAALGNLLRLLVERNRLNHLADIARVYRDLADARAGRLRGKVTSAVALSAEALKKLEKSLEKLTQRNVVLETAVDPSVLGGVATQVGSVLYDGTLRAQLQDIRRTLSSR